jgi:hypothetical protein
MQKIGAGQILHAGLDVLVHDSITVRGAEMMGENKKKTTYSSNCFFSLSSASRFSSFFGFGFLAAVGAGESACVDTFRQSNHALDEISAGSVPV